uniref:Putative vitellogenin-a1 n=1 Tax=Anopheles marajoara TaxID=58244 RepID=A0A2M4B8F5_9DIPT
MIAKLLLLTFVGFCTAYQYSSEYEFPYSRPINQTGFEFGAWEANREYVYNVSTKTMTALPDLEDYWTGIVTHGYLVIRPKDHNYVVAYIDRPTYAVFNEYLPRGYRTKLAEFDLKWQPMPFSSKPFGIYYNKGAVKGFYVEKTVPNHEVNMLKAWVSQFQLDTQGAYVIKSEFNQFPENNTLTGVFKTMEPSVTGECETLYDVNAVPEYFIQSHKEWVPQPQYFEEDQHVFHVVKTRNFDNCDERRGYHFGFSGFSDFKPNTNQMGNILTKSEVSQMYLTGDWHNYTIQSVSTVNKVVVSPSLVNAQKAMVYAQVNMTLNYIKPYEHVPEGPADDRQVFVDLVYSYNMAHDKQNYVRPANETEDSSSSSSDSSSSEEEPRENYFKISPAEQYSNTLKNVDARGNRYRRDLTAQKEKEYYESYKRDQHRLHKENDTSSSSDDSSSSSSSSSESDEHEHLFSSSSESDSDSLSSEEYYYQPIPESLKDAPQTPFLPYFTGYKGYSVQYARNVDATHYVYKLAYEIATELQEISQVPKSNTLNKFTILARVLRTMNYQDIYDVCQKLFVSQKEREEGSNHSESFAKKCDAWNTFRDALAQAGTPPAFKVIKELIEEKKLRGDEAATVIATLPKTIRYPTQTIMHEYFLLVTSNTVQHQEYLNVTALISYCDFLNRAQVNNQSAYNYYPVHSFGRLADEDYKIVAHKVVPWLSHQLREAVKAGDSVKVQVYIRCLGHLGHPEILNVFEPYLEGKIPVTHFQRLAMIVAFDRLVENYPRLARSVLFKVYQNTGDAHEVRCAAVYLLVRTKPPVYMLQRMAEQTHYDPSTYVRAAVKTALESASEADQFDDDDEFWQNAQAAIKHLNPRDFSLQYSGTYLRDFAFKELEMSYRLYFSQIASDDHYVPSGFFFHLRKNLGGLKRFSTFYYLVSSMETFFDILDKQYDTYNKHEEYKSNDYYYNYYKQYPSLFKDYFSKYSKNHKYQNDYFEQFGNKNQEDFQKWSTTRIAKMLNIDPEEAEELEGQFLFQIFNGERFFAFNNQTIEQFPSLAKKFFADFEDGYAYNFTKFYQQQAVSIAFPLATGLPFTYTLKTPTLFKFEFEATATTYPSIFQTPTGYPEKEFDDFIRFPRWFNGSADVNCAYSRLVDAKVGFITPFDHQRYVAGYQKKMQGYLPFSFDFGFDFENNDYEVNVQPLEPHKDVLLFHLSSWPYTGYKDITDLRPMSEQPSVRVLHDRHQTTKTYEQTFGERFFGVAFRFQAKYDKDFIDYAYFMKHVQQHDYWSALVYPFASETYHYHNLNLYYDAQRTPVKNVKFVLHHKQADYDQDFQTADVKHPKGRHGFSGYYNEYNYAQPFVYYAGSQRRQEQFMRNAGAGIRNSDVDVYDFGIVFEGKQQKAEFVFTTAYADSPVDEKERFLFFLSYSPYVSSSAFYEFIPFSGKQFQMCFSATNEYPNLPKLNFLNVLNFDKVGSMNWELSYGEKCQGGSHVSMKGKLAQSEYYRHYLRISEVGQYCKKQMDNGYFQLPACQNATRQAGYFDSYSFDFEYKDVSTYAKNMTYKFFDFARYMAFPYYSEDFFYQGKHDQFKFDFQLAPYGDFYNASFYGPQYSFAVENYPIDNEYARYFFAIHPELDYYERMLTYAYRGNYHPSCVVSNKFINTFDGKTFDYELGSCWHVLLHTVKPDYYFYAQDSHFMNSDYEYNWKNGFSEDEQMTILARHGENNQLYLKAILGQYKQNDYNIDIIPHGHELPHVYINGKPQQIHEKYAIEMYTNDDGGDQPLIRVYALPGNELEISFRDDDIKIVFDGYRARVFADQSYYNNFVGLCGTNNGEGEDDFITPDQCVMRKPEYFAGSYAIHGLNCSGPASAYYTEYHQKAQEHCVKPQYYFGNVISELEAGRSRYNYYYKDFDLSDSSSSESDESDSSSSSSSSSSEEDHHSPSEFFAEKQYFTEKECGVQHRVQYVEQGDKICFSIRPLPTCSSQCKVLDKVPKYVDVHCRDVTDSVAQLFKQQIRKGVNPDMSKKSVTKTVKFFLPKKCVHVY